MKTDLTNEQNDYAVFLPAISSFYATFIGKQQVEEYVEYARMPKGIPEMEMLNFLNDVEGIFKYRWGLYSAGHANLDLTKDVAKENMIRNRGPHTTMLADSGGFQIAKGVWEADWSNPNCPKAEKYRSTVLKWLCQISDYSMTLDIPTWLINNPEAADKTNIRTYEDAVRATKYNHEYFMEHATNNAKFLNVLQGTNHTDADLWYEEMKEYNDPTKHDNYFKGWAMGGANMADPHLAIKRVVTLIHDGLLEEGKHDWMHFLGTSKLEWAVLLTALQRAVRRTHNPNFTISFDCASPFLATANGKIYYQTVTPDHAKLNKDNKSGKWSYRIDSTADDKKYANDTRKFGVGTVADGIHEIFEDSPISERLMMKDICIYAPGALNKIGKEGKTSWDSFSYALMMGHNVWCHINSVQEANRLYDTRESIPKMLVGDKSGVMTTDIINAIFDISIEDVDENTINDELSEHFTNVNDEAVITQRLNELTAADGIEGLKKLVVLKRRLQMLNQEHKAWSAIVGARGMGGKKAISASGQFEDTAKFDVYDFDVDQAILDEEERLQEEANKQPKVADTGLFEW